MLRRRANYGSFQSMWSKTAPPRAANSEATTYELVRRRIARLLDPKTRRATIPGLAVVLIFLGVALPGLFRNAMFTEKYDEVKYHLPAIKHFAAELPHLDLSNYSSATTPLYHILFGLLLRIGCGLTTLHLVNFAISIATVLIVMRYLRRSSSDSQADCLAYSATLLLATSMYVVGPSIRLTTDNLALGSVVGVLYLLDRVETESGRNFAIAVILSVVAVLTRQLCLWLVPLLGAYALTNTAWDMRRRTIATVAALIPLISVIPLFLLWHGFTNSHFAYKHQLHDSIVNGKALVLAVCILGAFAMVFAPAMVRVLRPDPRGRILLLATFALAAVVLPMLDARAGSYQVPMEGGWLRAMAEHSPVVFHIWSLFWILFPIGCVVIAAMSYRAVTTGREIWMVLGLGLWLLLNIMQTRAMAKYYEPFEIVVVGRFAVMARSGIWNNVPVWMLTAVFVLVDIFRFWFGAPWASPGFPSHL